MENLGTFYYHSVYFTAIGNISWPFGIFCGHLVFFPRFGILYREKSGNPVPNSRKVDVRLREQLEQPEINCQALAWLKIEFNLVELWKFFHSILGPML
jgi:hypothetical protein